MKYRVGLVDRNQDYIDRLVQYLRENKSDEVLIVSGRSCEQCGSARQLNNLDLLIVDEEILVDMSLLQTAKLVRFSAKRNQEHTIFKFQSLEDIFQDILREIAYFQNDVSVRNNHDTNVRYIINGNELAVSSKQLDRIAYNMLLENEIEGFLTLLVDEQGKIHYDIKDCISLREYLQSEVTQLQRIEIIRQLAEILLHAEQYMLQRDHILLDQEHIFVQRETGILAVMYIPVNAKEQVIDCMKALCDLNHFILSTKQADFEDKPPRIEPDAGATTIFPELQELAKQSNFRQQQRKLGFVEEAMATLVRQSTQEKIIIDVNIFKIGKDRTYVDYYLNNPVVSKTHADIIRQGTEFYLKDNDSKNGTVLNGERLLPNHKVKLSNGDSIVLADEKFIFYLS